MPATEHRWSSFNLGRSFLRRDQVHSMEHATSHNLQLESFQRQVADRFHSLSSDSSLLSLSWIQNLLDTFLCCQEEFRIIIFNNQQLLNKSPMDKLISEYFERSVCNAIRDGIEQIRQWETKLNIVLSALDTEKNKILGEGQFRRARKALIDLAICMLDEKESNSAVAHRNRSFGRSNITKEIKNSGHFRSLSWSVSRGWSATKQIQAIGNLSVPKNSEIIATNGLSVAIFTMSSILYFVMWALVAAIPCQDRGLNTHFNFPRQFIWAGPILSIHNRILEESKRRRNSCGLMREIYGIEVCVRGINDLVDSVQFPIWDEKEREVRERVEGLREVLEAVKEGLGPVESGVREAFRGIVRSRSEGLNSFNRSE